MIKKSFVIIFIIFSTFLNSIELDIKSRSFVERNQIYLRDIVNNPRKIDKKILNTKLKTFPNDKSYVNITKGDLIKALHKKVNLVKVNRNLCTVRRTEENIKTTELKKEIRKFIRTSFPLEEDDLIEIQSLPDFSYIHSYKLNFEIVRNNYERGNLVLKAGLKSQNKTKQSKLIYCLIKRRAKHFALKTSKHRNEVISKEDIYSIEKETVNLESIIDSTEIIGKLASRYIPADKIISKKYLKEKPAVFRNDIVEVEVLKGTIKLRYKAVSKEEGKVGETITCYNPNSKKRFKAKITNKKQVQINLE